MLASQVWHAARECMRSGSGPAANTERVCALEAKSSADLRALSEVLTAQGIQHVLLCEPDAPWNGAPTAIGVDVCDRDLVKPLVAQFGLLR